MSTTQQKATQRKAAQKPASKAVPKEEAAKDGDVILSQTEYERLRQAAERPRMSGLNHIPKRKLDTSDMELPGDRNIDIPLSGNVATSFAPEIEIMDGPVSDDLEAELAFLEEFMVIEVQSTGHENEENPIAPSVNGRAVVIYRDTPVKLRRKYVGRLVHAKTTKFDQNLKNPDPITFNKYTEKTSQEVNFSVLDWGNNPQKARDWLNKLRRER